MVIAVMSWDFPQGSMVWQGCFSDIQRLPLRNTITGTEGTAVQYIKVQLNGSLGIFFNLLPNILLKSTSYQYHSPYLYIHYHIKAIFTVGVEGCASTTCMWNVAFQQRYSKNRKVCCAQYVYMHCNSFNGRLNQTITELVLEANNIRRYIYKEVYVSFEYGKASEILHSSS